MSVLIKGMKMPESCFYCRFRKKVNPEEIMCLATGEIFEETFTATIKMRNGAGKCPLIEVTEPHGRLIDASYKVDMPFYDDEYEEYSVRTVTVEELLMMADNEVPTVIEAEGE